MQEYLQKIVDKRRNEMEQGQGLERGDLLSLYIAHGLKVHEEETRAHILSDQYLKDMIMNFMVWLPTLAAAHPLVADRRS